MTRFLKGNLHTHTDRSDGDSGVSEVVEWYAAHRYRFLALTDHNRYASPQRFVAATGETVTLLGGEEITMKGGEREVHVNALCTRSPIDGGVFANATMALEYAIRHVDAQQGVAVVNHPNFDEALLPRDVIRAHAPLLEVMSGHPYSYSTGTPDRVSHESLWDLALSAGIRIMGVAVDDMHQLRKVGDPRGIPSWVPPAPPGRGWVEVFGDRTEPQAICDALRDGLLYFSTGAALRRIRVADGTYTVWPDVAGATVSFIGAGGRELDRSPPLEAGKPASHELAPADGYVRAKIIAKDGGTAWTPAIFAAR